MLCCGIDQTSAAFQINRKYQNEGVHDVVHMLRLAVELRGLLHDKVNFVVDGFHTRLFDHEREFRKRQRNKLARDAMKFNTALGPRDVVEHVKTRVRMTTSEERALFKYVSRNIA